MPHIKYCPILNIVQYQLLSDFKYCNISNIVWYPKLLCSGGAPTCGFVCVCLITFCWEKCGWWGNKKWGRCKNHKIQPYLSCPLSPMHRDLWHESNFPMFVSPPHACLFIWSHCVASTPVLLVKRQPLSVFWVGWQQVVGLLVRSFNFL